MTIYRVLLALVSFEASRKVTPDVRMCAVCLADITSPRNNCSFLSPQLRVNPLPFLPICSQSGVNLINASSFSKFLMTKTKYLTTLLNEE